jgi:transcriptional regulator with XRE-family HTH domain
VLSGLTPNYIGKLERGKVNPALSTMTLIAAGSASTFESSSATWPQLSPSAVRMGRLLDQAPPQIQRGVLVLLRGSVKLATKPKRATARPKARAPSCSATGASPSRPATAG